MRLALTRKFFIRKIKSVFFLLSSYVGKHVAEVCRRSRDDVLQWWTVTQRWRVHETQLLACAHNPERSFWTASNNILTRPFPHVWLHRNVILKMFLSSLFRRWWRLRSREGSIKRFWAVSGIRCYSCPQIYSPCTLSGNRTPVPPSSRSASRGPNMRTPAGSHVNTGVQGSQRSRISRESGRRKWGP